MRSDVARLAGAVKSLVTQFGRNTAGSIASQMILMGTGLVTVYVLTQALGRGDYGNYATAIALVYVSAPMLEIGINHVLARSVATDVDAERMWAINLTIHLMGAALGAILLGLIQPVILPEVGRLVVVLLVLSELIGPALVAGAVLAFEGAGRSTTGARLRVVSSLTRLAALGILVLLPERSLVLWCGLQVLAALVTAWFTVTFVERRLGLRPSLSLPALAEVRTGLSFASNQVASTGQKDADKVIMGYYSLNGEAADYTAGYRFVALGLIPLTGLLSGTYGQFFRSGTHSVAAVVKLAMKLTALSAVLLLPVTLGLFLGADLLPVILGDDFAESAEVVRLLAVLPVLKSLQGFANNALVGAGLLGKRVRAVVATLALNVFLNILWVPDHGWRGAAWATLIVEALLAAILWGALARASRREPPPLVEQARSIRPS